MKFSLPKKELLLAGLAVLALLLCGLYLTYNTSVSYTHLTLPTTERV